VPSAASSTRPTARHGLPTATVCGGMSRLTNEQAPITEWSPIVTPFATTVWLPI
jgi:hypothetical protein